jgi:hypothetical protein
MSQLEQNYLNAANLNPENNKTMTPLDGPSRISDEMLQKLKQLKTGEPRNFFSENNTDLTQPSQVYQEAIAVPDFENQAGQNYVQPEYLEEIEDYPEFYTVDSAQQQMPIQVADLETDYLEDDYSDEIEEIPSQLQIPDAQPFNTFNTFEEDFAPQDFNTALTEDSFGNLNGQNMSYQSDLQADKVAFDQQFENMEAETQSPEVAEASDFEGISLNQNFNNAYSKDKSNNYDNFNLGRNSELLEAKPLEDPLDAGDVILSKTYNSGNNSNSAKSKENKDKEAQSLRQNEQKISALKEKKDLTGQNQLVTADHYGGNDESRSPFDTMMGLLREFTNRIKSIRSVTADITPKDMRSGSELEKKFNEMLK